jgi:hypothetical protein
MNNIIEPYIKTRKAGHRFGNRSSKRTDVLNQETIKVLKTLLPDSSNWEFKTEYKINCARGDDFTVDIAAFYKNQLRCIFLLKAVESSFNKNRHNYANTWIGETSRIFDGPAGANNLAVIFIDWVPFEVPAPTPTNPEKVETTKMTDMTLAETGWNNRLKNLFENTSVTYCKIQFDYNDLNPDNITGTEKLVNTLRGIIL